ncbi:protein NUCLEAR FUSION DEFECTIVE 4-like [Quillaja saponaria]|uniref:Protein NUCLEAR FUSION DEFECTIVE 4-like n=1 Tax=Quillaja saponaria TaxID=32244 RepID=A0AAD7Q018_QUISA|nr:protein NUCLEAR FUSION DEFECTIVE 4-like [Quillaja saponaria]
MEYIGGGVVVCLLLFLPLAIVIREEFNHWKIKRQSLTDAHNTQLKLEAEIPPIQELPQIEQEPEPQAAEPASTAPANSQKPVSCWSNIFRPPDRGEDYTILQALFSIDMLILFIAIACGVDGTLTAIDNLGQIGNSQGYPTHSTSTFVSLKYKFPRPLMFTIVMLFSSIGHLLIAFAIPNSLYFSSVILGFCFGAQWPLLFAIRSEILGLKYYSTLYNFGAVATGKPSCPVGAYLLKVRVAGHLYHKEALKQLEAKGLTRKAGEDLTCTGVQCYKMAFLIITMDKFVWMPSFLHFGASY